MMKDGITIGGDLVWQFCWWILCGIRCERIRQRLCYHFIFWWRILQDRIIFSWRIKQPKWERTGAEDRLRSEGGRQNWIHWRRRQVSEEGTGEIRMGELVKDTWISELSFPSLPIWWVLAQTCRETESETEAEEAVARELVSLPCV